MIVQRAQHPGAHERHLLRKTNNPLFADAPVLDDDRLLEAQRLDYETLLVFQQAFQSVLAETVALGNKAESETILQLKDRLDQLYEQAAGVSGDQADAKDAIKRLLRFMMQAVRQGAGNDLQAQQELDQEEAARAAHFTLLGSPLVADLLNPDSLIQPDELLPSLLSSDKEELQLALQLFDGVQCLALLEAGAALLERLQNAGVNVDRAWQNLAFMQGFVEFTSELDKS